MKTYNQFVTEMQLKIPNMGQVAKTTGSILNPITGAAGKAGEIVTRSLGDKVGGQVGGAIKAAAPVVGTALGFARGATPVGLTALTFNQRTAGGRVRTGTYKGKPVYMDK